MKAFTQTVAKAEEIARESIAICLKKQDERKKMRCRKKSESSKMPRFE